MKFAVSILFAIFAIQFWEFSQSDHFKRECKIQKGKYYSIPDWAGNFPSKWQKNILGKSKQGIADPEKVGGGRDSDYIPFQVSIHIQHENGRKYFCGGNIYSKNRNSNSFSTIITAAHCFDGYSSSGITTTVVAGIRELNENSVFKQESLMCRVVIHEDYTSEGYFNDIALITLQTPLRRQRKRVEPVSITAINQNYLSSTAQISGWGRTFESQEIQNRLQVANITLQSCPFTTPENKGLQICGGGMNDACRGDSGGPLICFNKRMDKNYLCGLVSNGRYCQLPSSNRVGIYTNVTNYISWIRRNENINCY